MYDAWTPMYMQWATIHDDWMPTLCVADVRHACVDAQHRGYRATILACGYPRARHGQPCLQRGSPHARCGRPRLCEKTSRIWKPTNCGHSLTWATIVGLCLVEAHVRRFGRASTSVAAHGGMWAKVSHLAGCPLVATQTRGCPYRSLPLWSSTLCCGLALCASGHVARLVGACGRPRSVLGVDGRARVLCGRAFVGARAYANGKNPCPKGAEARCGDVGSVISQP